MWDRLRELALWAVSAGLFLYGLAIVVIGPLRGVWGGFGTGIVMLLVGGWGLRTMWQTRRDVRRLEQLSQQLRDSTSTRNGEPGPQE